MNDYLTEDSLIRSVDSETREVTGIAVPYGTVTRRTETGYEETFARGAIKSFEGVKVLWNHDPNQVIGRVIRGEDTEAGYQVTVKLSETAKGNEVYTLVRDGSVDKFSIRFTPVEDHREGDTVVRTNVNLMEVSFVPFPAYEGASVTSVRSQAETQNIKEEVTMSEDIVYAPESDVAELRSQLSDLGRKVSVLSEGGHNTAGGAPESKFRSAGEFVKALTTDHELAASEVRAFTGATTVDGNAQPAWVNRLVKLVDENRDILNLFSKAPHPGATSVVLPVLGSTSGTVAVQAAEGDDLGYMEVIFDDVTFLNKTYGGYSSLSKQSIKYSSANYLNKVLEFQALQYAKATNAAVRAALVAATGTATATLAADTYAGWADLLVDSAAALKTNGSGVKAEFALVATNVFKRLAHLTGDDGRPLMTVNNNGSNTIGATNALGLSGNVLGLTIVVDPGAANNMCYITSTEAATVMEESGAPIRLQDENIINLTEDFSLYGNMIVGVTNKLAIVKADVDLV